VSDVQKNEWSEHPATVLVRLVELYSQHYYWLKTVMPGIETFVPKLLYNALLYGAPPYHAYRAQILIGKIERRLPKKRRGRPSKKLPYDDSLLEEVVRIEKLVEAGQSRRKLERDAAAALH
jgi:hypothetical protein